MSFLDGSERFVWRLVRVRPVRLSMQAPAPARCEPKQDLFLLRCVSEGPARQKSSATNGNRVASKFVLHQGDCLNREELEQEIQQRLDRGDHDGAATVAVRGYGPEIFGFLHLFHRNHQDAADVFAIFSERLWRDLRTFRRECSFRTWAYTIARHSALNYKRDRDRRQARERCLPEGSELSAIVEQIRSEPPTYLGSTAQAKLAAIRESLPTDEQTLLVLRVDRNLSWKEIAMVLHDDAQPLDEAGVQQASARLRKRFELLKNRLRDQMRSLG